MALRLPARWASSRPLVTRAKVSQARCFAAKEQQEPIQPAAAPGSPAEIQEQQGVDPQTTIAPHVSEEAAQVSETTGGQGPEIDLGTPVQDIVKGDKEAQENLPQVMKDQLKKSQSGQQSRSYSTFARAAPTSTKSLGIRQIAATAMQQQHGCRGFSQMAARGAASADIQNTNTQNPGIVSFFDEPVEEEEDDDDDGEFDFEYEPDEDELEGGLALNSGLKFGPVNSPLPPGSHLRKRYDTLVDQVTKLMMKDGKLSVAQRNMSIILSHLRTSPAPHANSKFPLMPGAPPLSALPLNPVAYLGHAIDSVGPLFRLRSQRGAAGGGVALQLPIPLRQRQRRRTAVMWILDAVEKRKGGMSGFGKRFAEEIVSIVEGRSTCWAKREALHGLTIRARANLTLMGRGGGGRR